MSAFITYLGDDNVYHALTTIPIDGIEFTEQAEEGSGAISTVPVDDAGVAFEVRGLRGFAVYETDIPSGETRVFNGFTADREYTPLDGVSTQGRTVNLSLTDTNFVWGLRVMVGNDCKRPEETDVARMQWLVSTAEAGLITDTTYLSTASPVHMDKVDYRGATMDSIANDCAQASGKNWFLTYDAVGGTGVQVWYGKDELATYDSGCLLTNDHTVIDNATKFAISGDTKIHLDPGRVYSGIYGVYAKGAIYRQLHSTAVAFKHRDKVMQMPFVKTKAKAIARVERYLGQCDEEDVRIETTIWVSSVHANAVRCGQRVQFQSTMAAETLTAIECRVVKRTMSYWAPSSGGGHGMWKVDLTLVGGAAASVVACSTALSSVEVIQDDHQAYVAPGVISDTLTLASAGFVFAAAMVRDDSVTMNVTAGSGWTSIISDNAIAGHPNYLIQKRSHAAGSVTVNATFTPGFDPIDNDVWALAAAAFQTSATTVVQEKQFGPTVFPAAQTFTSPVTPGNMIVCILITRDENLTLPADQNPVDLAGDGWTTVAKAHYVNFVGPPATGDVIYILSRCATDDTAGPWPNISVNASIVQLYIAELAIS
jgi:hypothetical protein